MSSFLKTVNFDVDERNVDGIMLSSLLRSLSFNPSVSINAYSDLKNGEGEGLFIIDHFHIQMSRRINEDGEFSHSGLIIADNSDSKRKWLYSLLKVLIVN